MPQMAPINWYFLFLIFNFIMIIMISFNNFIKLPTFKIYNNNKFMKHFLIWKW